MPCSSRRVCTMQSVPHARLTSRGASPDLPHSRHIEFSYNRVRSAAPDPVKLRHQHPATRWQFLQARSASQPALRCMM